MTMHMPRGTVIDKTETEQGVWIAPYADCTCGWEWEGDEEFAYDGDASVFTRSIVLDRAADMAENHRIGWQDESRLAALDVSGTMSTTTPASPTYIPRQVFEMDEPLIERVPATPFPGTGKTSLVAKAFPSRWESSRLKIRRRLSDALVDLDEWGHTRFSWWALDPVTRWVCRTTEYIYTGIEE